MSEEDSSFDPEPFDPVRRRRRIPKLSRKGPFAGKRGGLYFKHGRSRRYDMARRRRHRRYDPDPGRRRHRRYDPARVSGHAIESLLQPVVADLGALTQSFAKSKGIAKVVKIGNHSVDLVGLGVQAAGAIVDAAVPARGMGKIAADLLNDFTTGYGASAVNDPVTVPLSTPAYGTSLQVVG